jgi:hypothetical protein
MAHTRIARGDWQQDIWQDLRSGQPVTNPIRDIKGRASSYAGRYSQSFQALLARSRAQGYLIRRLPGAHGGEWSATYTCTNAGIVEGRY